MRIKQVTENGNVATLDKQEIVTYRNSDNRNWFTSDNSSDTINVYNINNTEQTNYNINNVYESSYSRTDNFDHSSQNTFEGYQQSTITTNDELVICNEQYKIYTQNNSIFPNIFKNSETGNLEGATDSFHDPCETFFDDSNVSSNTTPVNEEQAFEHSDTDEMSENATQPVPRGIVNPNYPGFQHLAHTLQDYSSNIENYYHSENDMTDDDIDIEITETGYESEPIQNHRSVECKNVNNNNISNHCKYSSSQNDLHNVTQVLDSQVENEIPDLLKTISKNNNNVNAAIYDIDCSETDIENNFNAKDIIGDFNKEIEDEIKELLNYNINIQDDLEELRKDIKDTFAKPIENTINNISDVVNHVIKKLVETQTDENEQNMQMFSENTLNKQIFVEEIIDINKQNGTVIKTEMNLNRPTFFIIENNTDDKITDAFLSDAKEELKFQYESEYDTEKLSNSVENTIKQLSTELRKIIPKLDEMRERDRLWAENTKRESINATTILTDRNSNEIENSSKCNTTNGQYEAKDNRNSEHIEVNTVINRIPIKKRIEARTTRDRQKELTSVQNCSKSAHSNISVHRTNSTEDCDLASFDVYNIETALPKLDLDAIENHLREAKEAERRKRNDREEIRRRLAMGADNDEYYSMGHTDRPGKKPSLQSRLQSGMNLQICFMNETASDCESQASDIEKNINYNNKNLSRSSIFSKSNYSLNNHPYQTRPLSVNITKHDKISTVQSGTKLRPSSLSLKSSKSRSSHSLGHIELKESDFYALQATLQTEARIALAQAKEMARIQMERERRSRPVSPVTEMLRHSMQKASAPLAPDRRRVSRQLLTDMNIAQLQVIVNELHSQIESLNDSLVKLLMARDELHMSQDSMLVDIEDLTRYLGVKEQTKKTKGTTKSGVRRLTSLVHK